ncbi:MAG: hypothetical protein EBR71_12110 [Planctomycetes bacterium]|jgi:uncharacterized membrane-anchored protein|nr:hypothetical protein [Planctomycetota bacterium]
MRTKTLPRIDGLYWALVISSTTLGETAGDLISQTLGFGYGGGTIVLLSLFVVAMVAEVLSSQRHAWLYWTTLTLASIGGTTLSDWAARSLGLGYPIATAMIGLSLVATLTGWKLWTHSRDLRAAVDAPGESLYWLAILSSSTFGTAIGDVLSKDELNLDGLSLGDTAFGQWVANQHLPQAGVGLGDGLTTAILVGLLIVVTGLALGTKLSRVACYWAGIVVTHPLGAALGDYFTKDDGLNLGNAWSTLILAAALAVVGVIAARRKACES